MYPKRFYFSNLIINRPDIKGTVYLNVSLFGPLYVCAELYGSLINRLKRFCEPFEPVYEWPWENFYLSNGGGGAKILNISDVACQLLLSVVPSPTLDQGGPD